MRRTQLKEYSVIVTAGTDMKCAPVALATMVGSWWLVGFTTPAISGSSRQLLDFVTFSVVGIWFLCQKLEGEFVSRPQTARSDVPSLWVRRQDPL